MKTIITLAAAFIISTLAVCQNSDINYIEGELMVLFQNDVEIEGWLTSQNASSDGNFIVRQRLSQSLNLWLLGFDDGILSTADALLLIEKNRKVNIAQLNHTDLTIRSLPNDSLFFEQWAFDNNGSNGGSGAADISASEAWDLTTGGVTQYGDTIVVAVVDGGFMLTQEDLEENFYKNYLEIPANGIDDDQNGYIDDVQGWNAYLNSGVHFNDNHGTHVAGTVGAKGNNGIGVTGVNWDVKVMPVSGASSVESTVVSAYGYILDMRRLYNQTNGQKGAYVVATNSSFGVDYGDPAEYPLWCAMYDSLGYEGVLSAAATANLNINIDQAGDVPTACDSDFLLSVTNSTSSDVKNNGAAFGIQTIDLAAPGTQVYSTLPSGYGRLTGTSMATPHVAGTVGLMYSAICSETLNEYSASPGGLALYVRSKLLDEGVDELMSLDGLVATSGRLNLYKAVSSVLDSCLVVQADINASACGACNGSIQANVIGGIPPYSFLWSGGESTSLITDLCPGFYTLTATDASSETVVKSFTVSDITGPIVSQSSTNVTCPGGSDGSVILNGADLYVWDDGSQGNTKTDLSSGYYYVSAINQTSSCTTIVEIYIVEPNAISIDFSITNPQPSTASNGTVLAEVNGGTAPYIYDWSNGDNTAQLISLTSGSYTLTIEDAIGCDYSESVFLGFPVGSKNVVINSIQVFPNPSNGTIFISGLNGSDTHITVFDLSGRILLKTWMNGETEQVDLSRFDQGNYLVRIENSQILDQRLIQLVK